MIDVYEELRRPVWLTKLRGSGLDQADIEWLEGQRPWNSC
jgi:hypothetical protein